MPSQRARDIIYGRGGGHSLPDLRDPSSPFAKAVNSGYVVLARCGCPNAWWVVAHKVGTKCHVCREQYVEADVNDTNDERSGDALHV